MVRVITVILIFCLMCPAHLLANPPELKPLPKITGIQKGETAPYSGVLLNTLAAAQVFSDKSFAGKECELKIKFAVDKEVARMQLLLDSTKVSLETVEKKYTSIIIIKDNEIKRLSDLAMKDKADYSALWFTGGALAGIALTVAVIYAVQESK